MTTLSVPDMNCGHCKASVEAALAPLASQIVVDLAHRTVTLDSAANTDQLLVALLEVGFPATLVANPA
jgi:copper chaperone